MNICGDMWRNLIYFAVMTLFVNAKINLGLNVVSKREDGYHDLQTVFYPIGRFNGTPENPQPFCDILDIVTYDTENSIVVQTVDAITSDARFFFKGRPIDCPPEKNLVCKAFNLFMEELNLSFADMAFKYADIYLDKHIPDGAGLGGGSADASFVLKALNDLYFQPFSEQTLIEMAASLGADCPFFIINRPVYATGIGDIMTPVNLDLSGWWCIVAKNRSIHVSTADAFRGIMPTLPKQDIRDIISLPPSCWQGLLINDFETTVFKAFPLIEGLKEEIMKTAAVYTAMSGSGASVFGLYSSRSDAMKALYRLKSNSDLDLYLCML